MKRITLGSLFDGSGGFPLAGALNGITPVWASEVEPYPIAVTTSRFPNMKHLGSVTEINGAEVEPVDVITFGSPCQDLSVASAHRAGIHDGKRSVLFFQAIRIIKEMREATNGEYPKFAVFENVPGAFSSNCGADFQAVLESFAECAEGRKVSIPRSADGGRWKPAGEIVGDDWSVAWRVLDAQYWRTAQRRKRIYLIADFADQRAGEILFKRDCVCGNPAQGGTAREGASDDAAGGAGRSDCAGFIAKQGAGAGSIGYEVGRSPTLREGILSDVCYRNAIAFHATQDPITSEQHTPCIGANAYLGAAMLNCLNPWDYQTKRQYAVNGCFPALSSGERSGQNQQGVCYALQANGIDRADTAGCNGCGWRTDKSYTLNTIDRHAVCYEGQGLNTDENKAFCICTGRVDDHHITAVCYVQGSFAQYTDDKPLIRASGGDLGGGSEGLVVEERPETALCIGNGQPGGCTCAQVSNSLDCMHDQQAVMIRSQRKYIVRRLTPTECARLQGFPDCWGHPNRYEDMTDEQVKFWNAVKRTHAEINGKKFKPMSKEQAVRWVNGLHTDSSEYKMWGNGIALPCAEFVLGGIAEALRGGCEQ